MLSPAFYPMRCHRGHFPVTVRADIGSSPHDLRLLRRENLDKQTQTNIEAAVLRRFLQHLDARKDVQNIELMILAGFCRNCLSKWYKAAAEEQGVDLDMDDAYQAVYGMSYADWKANHQKEATPEQLAAYAATQKPDA